MLNRLGKSKIGFNDGLDTKVKDWQRHLQTRDLVKYGLIPEFIGRLPSVNVLNLLSKEDLVQILTEPTDSIIDQIKDLFLLDKVQIEFTISALEEVATIAIDEEMGARGLRKILDEALLDIQYELKAEPILIKGTNEVE